MWNKIKEFINKYGQKILLFILNGKRNILLSVIGLLGIIYLIISFSEKNNEEQKIIPIDKFIDDNNKNIERLDSIVSKISVKIDSVRTNISEIEKEKIIIKEIYYEKIDRVSSYNDAELDSFFSNRYGYSPR